MLGIALVVSGCWTSFLMVIFTFKSAKVEVWFQLECAPEPGNFFYVATFFLWYPDLFICYSNM